MCTLYKTSLKERNISSFLTLLSILAAIDDDEEKKIRRNDINIVRAMKSIKRAMINEGIAWKNQLQKRNCLK